MKKLPLLYPKPHLKKALEKTLGRNFFNKIKKEFPYIYIWSEEKLVQEYNAFKDDTIITHGDDNKDVLDSANLLREAYAKLYPEKVINPKLKEKVGSKIYDSLSIYGLTDENAIRNAYALYKIKTRKITTLGDLQQRNILANAVKALDRALVQ